MPITTFEELQREFAPDIEVEERRRKYQTEKGHLLHCLTAGTFELDDKALDLLHQDDRLDLIATKLRDRSLTLGQILPIMPPEYYHAILNDFDTYRTQRSFQTLPFDYLATLFPSLQTADQAKALCEYHDRKTKTLASAIRESREQGKTRQELDQQTKSLDSLSISFEVLAQELSKMQASEEKSAIRFAVIEHFCTKIANEIDLSHLVKGLTINEQSTLYEEITEGAAAETPALTAQLQNLCEAIRQNHNYERSLNRKILCSQPPRAAAATAPAVTPITDLPAAKPSHTTATYHRAGAAAASPDTDSSEEGEATLHLPLPQRNSPRLWRQEEEEQTKVRHFLNIYKALRVLVPLKSLRTDKWGDIDLATHQASVILGQIKTYKTNHSNSTSAVAWKLAELPTISDQEKNQLVIAVITEGLKQSCFASVTLKQGGPRFFRTSAFQEALAELAKSTKGNYTSHLQDSDAREIRKILGFIQSSPSQQPR